MVALGMLAAQAAADTYKAHDGRSLSDAVAKANASSGQNTIELSAGTYVPSETLTLRGDITLTGPSAAPAVKIDGGGVSPPMSDLFVVAANAKVTFVNVEMTTAGAAGSAAAIDASGTVDVEDSTLAGNNGPGLLVQPGAHATIRNSTLSDGLDAGLVDHGEAKLINVTVAANVAGGIDATGGSLGLVNSIVAGNGHGDCSVPASTTDASLDGDGSCGVGALARTNPMLGPLMASNGGPTPTRALSAGSPAINRADNASCPTEDQRHYARSDGRCDIGAFQTSARPAAGSGTAPGGPGGSGRPQSHKHAGGGERGVSGHGTLRGARRSRIAFSVRALVGRTRARFSYDDKAARVRLRALSISSLKLDVARKAATLRGSATELFGHHRVTFTAVFTGGAPKRRSLRIRLSSGYAKNGRLVSGSIALISAA